MRKMILIGTMILISTAAVQAGETRSLSLANADINASAAPRPVAAVQTAEVVQLPPAPLAQPAPVAAAAPAVATTQTAAATPTATPTATQPATTTQPASAPSRPRRAQAASRRSGGWNEGRIVSELHNHGIYW